MWRTVYGQKRSERDEPTMAQRLGALRRAVEVRADPVVVAPSPANIESIAADEEHRAVNHAVLRFGVSGLWDRLEELGRCGGAAIHGCMTSKA